jgi:DNA-binding XRE family transcriptional regulator
MSEQTTLAEGIRDGREYVGFTAEKVAKRIGVPVETYLAFEDGSQEPTEEQQVALGKLFGLTPERLRGAPLQANVELSQLLDSKDLTDEDRYSVLRFVEFLGNVEPAPRVDRSQEAER